MTVADWHIVRSGHPQILGDQRQITGDPFQFLPLFRTHRDAESYCRTSGLWHQGIRPRQNSLATVYDRSPTAGLSILLHQAIADGVNAIGIFVGFDTYHQSCWEYYRVSSPTLGGMPKIETLPEDERPKRLKLTPISEQFTNTKDERESHQPGVTRRQVSRGTGVGSGRFLRGMPECGGRIHC
jgi:hypothetical protein